MQDQMDRDDELVRRAAKMAAAGLGAGLAWNYLSGRGQAQQGDFQAENYQDLPDTGRHHVAEPQVIQRTVATTTLALAGIIALVCAIVTGVGFFWGVFAAIAAGVFIRF